MKKQLIILTGLISFIHSFLFAQDQSSPEIPQPTEQVIPASPAYQMLDANSALVSTPGAIRDFKVDWSFKTYRLAPNLSIEAQPVYSIFYNRPTPQKYQNAGKFLQTLSTLSVSAGSLDFNDSIRLFAVAGKITLWRSYDPLASNTDYSDIINDYAAEDSLLQSQLALIRNEYLKADRRLQKDSLEKLLYDTRDRQDQLKLTQKNKIKERQEFLKSRYWNASAVDVAFGKSYAFNTNISDQIDTIKFQDHAIAGWVNASVGIGRYFLLSALVKGERVNVVIADSGKATLQDVFVDPSSGDTTFVERDSLFVNFNKGQNDNLSIGLNFRFGTPRYSFFVEGFMAMSELFTFNNSTWEDYPGYGNKGRRKLSQLKREYTVAFGGEWRISNNVLLSYGIRTLVDDQFKFKSLVPLASISCLMR